MLKFVLAALVFAMATMTAESQQQQQQQIQMSGQVSFVVTDVCGNPIVGADVTMTVNDGMPFVVATDCDGKCTFTANVNYGSTIAFVVVQCGYEKNYGKFQFNSLTLNPVQVTMVVCLDPSLEIRR